MSTRSIIALKTGENRCLAARCHYDGYPENNGAILLAAYNTEERVRALLALGELESLGPELGEKHDRSDKEHPDWCFAYGRDGGEKNTAARDRTITGLQGERVSYIYLFDQGTWLISRDARVFSPLAEHPALPKPEAIAEGEAPPAKNGGGEISGLAPAADNGGASHGD